MRVLVTGATGQLGASLLPALAARGHAVRVLARRDSPALTGFELEICRGDVRDPASLAAACDGVEVVFHLAGVISVMGDPDGQVMAVNADGTRKVVHACREAGVRRLVHFSSIHALQDTGGPVLETNPLALSPKGTAYARSKALGEVAVLEGVAAGLDAVILNPTGVVGPRDFVPSPIGTSLLRMATGAQKGGVQGGFGWVDVRDVAEAALAAVERGRRGERYLLNARRVTMPEISGWVAEETGGVAPRQHAPLWLARALAPIAMGLARLRGTPPLFTVEAVDALRTHAEVSNEKAKAELGFSPREPRETLRDTLAWFREQGQLA